MLIPDKKENYQRKGRQADKQVPAESIPFEQFWQNVFDIRTKNAVIKLVEERPDITLKEIIEELKLPIKKSRVSKILLNEKMFFKKETGTRK